MSFPNELFLLIADELFDVADAPTLLSFTICSRHLYSLVMPYLVSLALRDHSDGTPSLHVAIIKRHVSLARLLIRHLPLHALNRKYSGSAAIHIALTVENDPSFDLARLLITADGIDINIENSQGLTPLHIASYLGATAMVGLLLRKEATVNAITGYGDTVLHLLLKSPMYINDINAPGASILRLLLNAPGIDIEAQTPTGESALTIAAASAKTDAVDMLIQCGASLRSTTIHGDNALHLALKSTRYCCTDPTLPTLLQG